MAESNSPSSWRRSSRCDSATCVEVAYSADRKRVYLRNSQEPDRHLEFSAEAWRAFCAGVVQLDSEAG